MFHKKCIVLFIHFRMKMKDLQDNIVSLFKVVSKIKARIDETHIKKLNPVHGGLLNFSQLLKLSDCRNLST